MVAEFILMGLGALCLGDIDMELSVKLRVDLKLIFFKEKCNEKKIVYYFAEHDFTDRFLCTSLGDKDIYDL